MSDRHASMILGKIVTPSGDIWRLWTSQIYLYRLQTFHGASRRPSAVRRTFNTQPKLAQIYWQRKGEALSWPDSMRVNNLLKEITRQKVAMLGFETDPRSTNRNANHSANAPHLTNCTLYYKQHFWVIHQHVLRLNNKSDISILCIHKNMSIKTNKSPVDTKKLFLNFTMATLTMCVLQIFLP